MYPQCFNCLNLDSLDLRIAMIFRHHFHQSCESSQTKKRSAPEIDALLWFTPRPFGVGVWLVLVLDAADGELARQLVVGVGSESHFRILDIPGLRSVGIHFGGCPPDVDFRGTFVSS